MPKFAATPQDATVGLPDAELDVLSCLWRHGPMTAADIRLEIQPYRPMAHGSVLTLLARLSDRGLVSREKSGRGKAFAWQPTRRPEPTYRRLIRRLVHRLFGGDRLALVATLLDSEPVTDEELAELRALVSKLSDEQNESTP